MPIGHESNSIKRIHTRTLTVAFDLYTVNTHGGVSAARGVYELHGDSLS